jgi:sulfatase maturation enzyme AslB (radical SAM superfamily)
VKEYLLATDYLEATEHLPRIQYLETMTTYACTLSCKWCTNYSDYGMKGGYVKWETIKPTLDKLFSRMRVDCFGFIGGEPFLNPELETWVREFKTNYPYVTLMILTNGQLFMKNQWILDCMEEYGMIYLKVSEHQPGEPYFEDMINTIKNRFSWKQVDSELYFYQEKILDFEIAKLPTFLKTYQGEYGSMKPYNSNPDEAFKICNQQICPILEDGKLYKCSSVGMLNRVLGDHNQLDDSDWQPYLNTGLSLDCTDEELRAWADNFGKPNEICRMCPTHQDTPYYPHYQNVTSNLKPDFYQKIIKIY